MKVYLMETNARRNSTRYPYSSMYAVQGAGIKEYYKANFINSIEAMTHGNDLEEIRSYIAKLNDIKEAEGSTLTQVRYEECLLNVWLPMISRLIINWTVHLVPGDIRRVSNNVRASLNLPITDWPTFNEIEMAIP